MDTLVFCSNCKESYPDTFFTKKGVCKNCNRKYGKAWRAAQGPDYSKRLRARSRELRGLEPVPEKLLRECRKCFVVKDISLFKRNSQNTYGREHICQSCQTIQRRTWRKTPGGSVLQHARDLARQENPTYRFGAHLSALLRAALKKCGLPKRDRTSVLLGYTPQQLYDHLSTAFNKPCGWCGEVLLEGDNSAIDHIVPISQAKTEEEVLALNKLENLRLLHGRCNGSKKDRLLLNSNGDPLPALKKPLKVRKP